MPEDLSLQSFLSPTSCTACTVTLALFAL